MSSPVEHLQENPRAFGTGRAGGPDEVPLPGTWPNPRRAPRSRGCTPSTKAGRTRPAVHGERQLHALPKPACRELEAFEQKNIGFSTSFSPTPLWALSWSTQFNATTDKFESHILRLERDLHEWRAGFNFVKSANGNFSFFFSVFLTDLPAVKIDYDQTTFED
jgi:hypothetical protein